MRCDKCGKLLRLDFKEIQVDTLIKHYLCQNNHKTVFRRYGKTIEINGRKMQIDEQFNLTEAVRSEARKRIMRDLLPKATSDKAI